GDVVDRGSAAGEKTPHGGIRRDGLEELDGTHEGHPHSLLGEELRRRGGASGDRLVQAGGLVERGDGAGDGVELERGHRSCSGAEAGREGRGKGSRRLARNACLKEKAMAVNGKILEITDANFVEEVRDQSGLSMVDFWATWCGPCRIIAPIVEKLAEEY